MNDGSLVLRDHYFYYQNKWGAPDDSCEPTYWLRKSKFSCLHSWEWIAWCLHHYGEADKTEMCSYGLAGNTTIKAVDISTLPHSEACLVFELGVMWEARTHNGNPPWPGFEDKFSWLWGRCFTTELSHYSWEWHDVYRKHGDNCTWLPVKTSLHVRNVRNTDGITSAHNCKPSDAPVGRWYFILVWNLFSIIRITRP